MILEVQFQNFSAHAPVHAHQSFHFLKIPGGPNINSFLWKLAWSFLLHIRTNGEIQMWNLTFKKYHFGPPKKCVFGFWRNPPPKKLSSCFAFDSALNTIDARMFFWSVFLKTQKKSYWPSKTPFCPFLMVNNNFYCRFKKMIKITFVRLLFLKLNLKRNIKNIFYYAFYCKNWKMPIFGGQPIFSKFSFQFQLLKQ